MEHSPDIRYIRPRDVARMYSISPKMVYLACESGDLPSRRIAKKVILVDPIDVEKWLKTLESRTAMDSK